MWVKTVQGGGMPKANDNHYRLMASLLVLILVLAGISVASCTEPAPVQISAGISPSWSPDGSRILFVHDSDIYAMDPDGGNRTKVPRSRTGFPGPLGPSAWSPDGNRIVYASPLGIITVGIDGGNPVTVVEGSPMIPFDLPSWSPDGKRIVYYNQAYPEGPGVYVVDIDGVNPTRLSPAGVDDGTPAWSPDGTKLAFTSRRDGIPEIYMMDADGSNPVRLTDSIGPDKGFLNYYPVWSPDGSRIAYVSSRDGQMDIYVMDLEGRNETRLTKDGNTKLHLSWSPDGSRIAYSEEPDGESNTYITVVPVRG